MILDGIRKALDWNSLAFDLPAPLDTHYVLLLPPGGIPVRNLSAFAAAISQGSELVDFLDPEKMGPENNPFKTSTSSPALFLTRFEINSEQADSSYLLNLQWRGAIWELIPELLSIHEPSVTLGMTPGGKGTKEQLRATLFGRFLLADAIDVDLYATLWREAGKNQSPTIFGNLAPGGPYKLKPLLSHFGFDLPGTDDLVIDELSFFADPGNDMISFQISLGDVWKPRWGDGKFELTNVTFNILRSAGVYTGMIKAMATIIGQKVDVVIENQGDGWWFSVEVLFKSAIKLGHALEELGNHFGMGNLLSQAPGFEHLEIDSVGIEIGLDNHQLHFSMATDHAFEPDWCKGFKIEGLTFDITHRGKPLSSTAVKVSGDVLIAGQPIEVSADYGGRSEGWTFTGKSEILPKAASGDNEPAAQSKSLAKVELPSGLGLEAKDFPLHVDDVSVTGIEFSVNTLKKNFSFALAGSLDQGSGQHLEFGIDIHCTRLPEPQEGYQKQFAGHVILGGMEFDLLFSSSVKGKTFVAAYQNHAGKPASISHLVDSLIGGESLIPDLHFGIRDAVLVAVKKKEKGYDYLLAVDIDGGVNLSALPLVSKVLPNGDSVRVAFQPLYASRAFTGEEVEGFQALLPPGSATLKSQPADAAVVDPGKEAIGQGFNLITHMRVGDQAFDLDLPLAAKAGNGDPAITEAPSYTLVPKEEASQPSVKWINIQKGLGPVHFERVGLGIDLSKMELEILLDASLGMGGLTLSLMGLGAGYLLNPKPGEKQLEFLLDGLGLSYQGGPTKISGSFLRLGAMDFAGEAMIRTPTFGLSALGAYKDAGSYKSLFVYAFLDYPLGGPPFCFVEGLAAGFGYNRKVREMEIGEVADFPFIKEAVAAGESKPAAGGRLPPASGETAQASLMAEMRTLDSWIDPSDGEHFLAVGLKFNTFQIVDSFALAIVSFGQRFRFDVLGISTAVLPPRPPDAPPTETTSKLAKVEMEFQGRYDPVEGLLGVEADLTKTSWVLSEKCLLSGGFAYYSWFGGAHAGDFVTTLGGYHKDFKVPDHYPSAKRLTLTWQVCDQVEIKGNCYFALTPDAMMAGGHLEARWHCGDLWATFAAGADFLMQWKPFYYRGHIDIEMSAGYGSLSGSIGAGLVLQGPEFSGTAHFKFLFVSFHVDFNDAPAEPSPLLWDEFRKGFLPANDDAITTVGVQAGVIRTLDEPAKNAAKEATTDEAKKTNKRWIVNPKQFLLATSSLVPTKELAWHESAPAGSQLPSVEGLAKDFGVAPMQKRAVSLSTHCIAIERLVGRDQFGEQEWEHVEDHFKIIPASKPFPAAMWGTAGVDVDLDKDPIRPLLGQTVIEVKEPVRPGQTSQIQRRNLNYDVKNVIKCAQASNRCIEYPDLRPMTSDPSGGREKISKASSDSAVREGRKALIDALGIKTDNEIRLGDRLAESFILTPVVVAGTAASIT
jgi:hypothetical protein